MQPTLRPLPLALAVAISPLAQAADPATVTQLEPIRISASPLALSQQELLSPATVLQGAKLDLRRSATLGELLDGEPGIYSDTFGAGASRPVIRGQTAPRVTVLSDGSQVMDASAISPDHAITVDPWLAERVEVLRGPSALLYGGNAIGGVVNVLDRKIPQAIPENGFEGAVQAQGSTGDRGHAAAVELTAGQGNVAVHVEGSSRRGRDYRVPNWTDSRVKDSHARSDNMSVGLSFIGERGYLGAAYSYREDRYGLPGHSHEYEDCHPHGATLHCGGHGHHHGHDHSHGHDHDHEHEHTATAVLRSERIDLRGELRDPLPGFQRARLRAGITDYRHVEKDGDIDGTRFSNRGYDGRLELEHRPLGPFTGVVGLQTALSDFESRGGSENFIPKTRSRSHGLFVLENLHWQDWRFEFGARQEWQSITPDSARLERRTGTANSFSAGAIWDFAPQYSASVSVSRSQRLPNAQELYARGVHFATLSYERGNPNLTRETSQNVDLGLQKHAGDLRFDLRAFYTRSKDYIYGRTLDRHEDFSLIQYSQDDARFWGLEGTVSYPVRRWATLSVFGDIVRGKLLNPSRNLPRMPSARLGVRADVNWQQWSGFVDYTHTFAQSRLADFEQRSPSYGLLGAGLSYQTRMDHTTYTLYLKGNNLLDKLAYNHTSFIARQAPLMGRNIMAGIKVQF
ncbi:MAG TPA: TonB-dependent receptor [Alcaligenes sp.]|nr:TonB-dependent receptor [Alcaligenes sp.]HRL26342.1 TonB-dependent receptor [Alcaligenes sp.]